MDYFDWYAAYLHRTCPVVDAHLDLVTEVYRRRLAGEKGILNKYYRNEFQKSGVNLVFASLFLGKDELEACREDGIIRGGAVLKKSMEMLAAFYEDMAETKGRIQLVTDRESLGRVTAKKGLAGQRRTGVLLYLEGLDMLEGEPELLYCFYQMGVRGAALTWNQRPELKNVFAEGVSEGALGAGEALEEGKCGEGSREADREPSAEWGKQAVTGRGVRALFLMEKLGIFVDSSHLGRQAAWLLPSFTKKPYAATHSNVAALRGHPRNLTDEEIKEIADRGGVIGVNGYRDFNCCPAASASASGMRSGQVRKASGVRSGQAEKASGIDALCDQIIYLMKTAGECRAGLGLDLGEGNLLAGYGELPKVTAELLRRGCSIEAVKKVLGGNWIRYLMGILH